MILWKLLSIFMLFLGKIVGKGSDSKSEDDTDDSAGIFEIQGKEFIFVRKAMAYDEATAFCEKQYKADLAIISTATLANYIGNIIPGIELNNSSFWVGAKIFSPDRTIYWMQKSKKFKPLKPILKKLIVNYDITDRNRQYNGVDYELLLKGDNYGTIPQGKDCLAIDREFTDIPRLIPSNCSTRKPMICERAADPVLFTPAIKSVSFRSGSLGDLSTHPDWIDLNGNKYKIFSTRRTVQEAELQCESISASLATIYNSKDAAAIAMHLLIGRPSLELAWISASINKSPASRALIQIDDNYPQECLVLDRHAHNNTHFVESKCDNKLRPYICYKKNEPKMTRRSKGVTEKDVIKFDIIIDFTGYRIYFKEKPWEDAKDHCDMFKEKYEGMLVEPRNVSIMMHLLHAMARSKHAISMIWIGGKLDANEQVWRWLSDNTEINTRRTENWVKNDTYNDYVERDNTCLNMHRERIETILIYGTRCQYPQHYVCSFPYVKFEQLREKEAKNETYRRNHNEGSLERVEYKQNFTGVDSEVFAVVDKPIEINTKSSMLSDEKPNGCNDDSDSSEGCS